MLERQIRLLRTQVRRLRLRIVGRWRGLVERGIVLLGRTLCRPLRRDVVGLEVGRRTVPVEGLETGIE